MQVETSGMVFGIAAPAPGKTASASAIGSIRPRYALAAALGLGLGLGGCLGYDGQVVHGYQGDARTVDQVKVGSSAEQVLTLLGTPTTTSTVGGDAWYYVTQVTNRDVAFLQPKLVDQRVFAVYFDKNKKVQRVANYGVQDGKVFDFVSRTTPTAGAESTFLKGMFINLLRF
jgi:outer membrane protein assembly factor BamE (lipoprotein component of BamABCDE complex)